MLARSSQPCICKYALKVCWPIADSVGGRVSGFRFLSSPVFMIFWELLQPSHTMDVLSTEDLAMIRSTYRSLLSVEVYHFSSMPSGKFALS